jgi:hypothetical protein
MLSLRPGNPKDILPAQYFSVEPRSVVACLNQSKESITAGLDIILQVGGLRQCTPDQRRSRSRGKEAYGTRG